MMPPCIYQLVLSQYAIFLFYIHFGVAGVWHLHWQVREVQAPGGKGTGEALGFLKVGSVMASGALPI